MSHFLTHCYRDNSGRVSCSFGIRAWIRYQENTLSGRSDSRTRTLLLYTVVQCLPTWAQQGKSTSCVFFNGWVFYHPGGDFYTMGCYKIQKIISKIKKLTEHLVTHLKADHHLSDQTTCTTVCQDPPGRSTLATAPNSSRVHHPAHSTQPTQSPDARQRIQGAQQSV